MNRTTMTGLMLSLCYGAFGQAQFDVGSVKPNDMAQRGGEGSRRQNVAAKPGSLTMQNVTLKTAIMWAYNVQDYQVSGPGWLSDVRFDISGRAPASADEPQLRAMLQTLLANRFKMTVHHETKEVPMYALVVDKGGIKMKPSNGDGPSKLQPNGLGLVATDTSVQDIADFLSNISSQIPVLSTPVIDATGLKGRYNFTVDGSAFVEAMRAALPAPGQNPPADVVIDGVQEVLRSQLGLKGELRKAPGDFVVIDHVERTPVEN